MLLLSPGTGIVSLVSDFFGGSEISDGIGHVIIMTVNFLLFYTILCQYKPAKQAQMIVTVFVIMTGLSLELGQFFVPSRSVSLIDILAVFIGVSIATVIINLPIRLNLTSPVSYHRLSTQ